ncbi:MAG: glycoside hydrolase family 127 protein [Bacteroidales bacterium]|nr:glycoside hydrolase family 127 protein [Bacteroidales bacterium]
MRTLTHIFLAGLVAVTSLTQCKKAADTSVPAPPHAVFSEGLIDKIQPEGWLKEILQRQADGLTGHPEAMAYPYNSVLWAGTLERDSESRGADWWRFEQTAYYLDGLTRLGFLLDDPRFLDVWQQNIDYVLAHPLPFKAGLTPEEQQAQAQQQGRRPQRDFNAEVSADPRAQARARQMQERRAKQQRIAAADRPEGRLGPETGSMAWPWAVFFRAVKAYYEATGDPRIPEALEKNYLSYTVEELGMNRFVVNVEGMLWTYSITRNPELLNRAIAAWNENASELTQENALDDSPFTMHGVTMNELLKIPMLLYAYTGEQKYLDAAIHAEAKMEGPNMLIDGINSSTEALAGNDPLASHETCDVSDYTWTMGYYLMTTGDGQWADRIEKGIFNGGLGSITKDFKSMQYFSCPNQVIATGNSDHNRFKYGKTWMAYRPIHETECCIGNLHRFMPNYVARMWLRDAKGMPVAALYGPSSVEYDLGKGVTVKIEEKTGYPFEEQVRFEFSFFKDGKPSGKEYAMDFTYRIPGWCKADKPGFKTVSKTWKTGDVLTVDLPMDIEIVDNPVAGTSVQRGPIVYTYAVPAKVEEDPNVYDNMAGKVSANPDFKSWSMTPDGKWNYALVRNSLDDLQVEKTGAEGFPFDLQSVPVKIRVPVVGVKGWTLKENRFTPALPDKVKAEGPVQYIDLVPYGSTTLRLTIFPIINQ